MNTFVIARLNVLNAEKLQQYSAAAGPIVKSYGGEFLAKGACNDLHGESKYATTVVVRFPDLDSANGWYNSTEYQAIIPLRNEAMESHFQVIT